MAINKIKIKGLVCTCICYLIIFFLASKYFSLHECMLFYVTHSACSVLFFFAYYIYLI